MGQHKTNQEVKTVPDKTLSSNKFEKGTIGFTKKDKEDSKTHRNGQMNGIAYYLKLWKDKRDDRKNGRKTGE